MATVEECRAALHRLADHLLTNADKLRYKIDVDRSIACRVTDLAVAFCGRLTHGELHSLREADDPQAEVTLAATSDDLIALVDGELDFLKAVATRRLSIKASPRDLWKLRSLR